MSALELEQAVKKLPPQELRIFSEYFRETPNINLMERVDEQGNILGFAVEGLSKLKPGQPLEAELVHA